MFSLKFFVLLLVSSTVTSDVLIPESFKNAKDISTHPMYQGILKRSNPKLVKDVSVNPFIIGGEIAERGQIPHQVLIFIVYSPQEVYLCGGSLIDREWVLTAGHCAYGNPQHLQVYTGVASLQGPASYEFYVTGSDIHVHPYYDHNTLNNDIALLKLAGSPENLLSDLFTATIMLPYSFEDLDLVGSNGTISGFGKYSDLSPNVSENLKFNFIPVIPNSVCEAVYGSWLIHDTNICAETTPEASTCNGDSGGPYTFNVFGFEFLFGVTSFGALDGCQLGYPVGFTRVTKYLEWIQATMTYIEPPPELNIWEIILQFLCRIFGGFFCRV